MALSKVTYVDGVTIITAKNLNDIQDELIRQGEQQAEDEAELALKANAADVQTALALKADKSDTYTKAEVDEALGLKANTADVNEALALKADKTETYTKAQVDSIVEDAIAEAVKESEYSNFEMKSVSGDFIHITDGAGLIPVKDLKIGIDAVRDLHGYDAPWVGGAGVNKFGGYTILNAYLPASGSIVAESNNRTAVLPCLPSTQYTLKIVRTAITGSDDMQVSEFSGDTEPTYGSSGTRVDAVGYNSTTNIAQLTFTTSADTKWLAVKYANINQTNADKTIETAQLELGSSVGDFSPYANICPISGWTGAKVSVNGVNQWDEEWEGGRFNLSTGAPASGNGIRSKNMIRVLPATEYYVTRGQYTGSTSIVILYYDDNGNYISYDNKYGYNVTFTTPQNAKYIHFNIQTSSAITTYNHDISINYPSTDTDYHAYDGHVYSVTWQTEAGTVYGGTLDVTTGELVVDKAEVDLGTLTWSKQTDGQYYADLSPRGENDPSGQNLICSMYKGGDAYSGVNNRIAIRTGTNCRVWAMDASQTGAGADFKSYVNGQQLVYKTETPQTYQLTPTEVLTLLGENNIFADTGAVEELIYRISRQ